MADSMDITEIIREFHGIPWPVLGFQSVAIDPCGFYNGIKSAGNNCNAFKSLRYDCNGLHSYNYFADVSSTYELASSLDFLHRHLTIIHLLCFGLTARQATALWGFSIHFIYYASRFVLGLPLLRGALHTYYIDSLMINVSLVS